MIPGAEHAPDIEIGMRPSMLGDWERVVRRLSVTNPDDRRVIWRLAALQLGATEAQAEVAVMLRAERDWWVLRPATYQSKAFYLARVHAPDLAHATAALCAAVWGPI